MLMPKENLMISPMLMPLMIRKLKVKWEMVKMRKKTRRMEMEN